MKAEESNRFRRPIEDTEWLMVLNRVRHALKLHDRSEIRSIARLIAEGIGRLDVFMTKYCGLTCPSCKDPCCHGKDIFYNQADLFYLSALGRLMPPTQTRSHAMELCRYLGPNGCHLPRTSRPYVCVWFLCDAQMAIFQEENAPFQRSVISTMQQIRAHRLKLESLLERAFIDA